MEKSINNKYNRNPENITFLMNKAFIPRLAYCFGFDSEEYYNYISIYTMINYILTYKSDEYSKYQSWILTLLKSFNTLLYKHSELSKEEYTAYYEDFDKWLYEQEDYFYCQVFERTEAYDELIDKVTNILDGDDS